MGMFNIVGTTGSGWLSDRVDNRILLAVYYSLRGLSLSILPFSFVSFYGLGLFAVFYGLDWIATVPPTVRLIGHVVRPREVRHRLRLGLRRASDRQRVGRLFRRPDARRPRQLPAGVHPVRTALHRRPP